MNQKIGILSTEIETMKRKPNGNFRTEKHNN